MMSVNNEEWMYRWTKHVLYPPACFRARCYPLVHQEARPATSHSQEPSQPVKHPVFSAFPSQRAHRSPAEMELVLAFWNCGSLFGSTKMMLISRNLRETQKRPLFLAALCTYLLPCLVRRTLWTGLHLAKWRRTHSCCATRRVWSYKQH